MNEYLLFFKKRYETCSMREKLLIIVLSGSLLYAIFYFLLFKSLEVQAKNLITEIQAIKDQIKAWDKQITNVKKISTTPLYKQWITQHQNLLNIKKQYKLLFNIPSHQQWQTAINSVLYAKKNITVVQIKNSPEILYHPSFRSESKEKIYQQKFLLVVRGNYVDMVHYLQSLEKSLPMIYWDSLNYQVMEYPTAQAEMEFSILYEKNS